MGLVGSNGPCCCATRRPLSASVTSPGLPLMGSRRQEVNPSKGITGPVSRSRWGHHLVASNRHLEPARGVGLPADDCRPPQAPKRLHWLRSLRAFAGGERGGLQGYLKAYRGIWSWVSLHLSPTRIYPSRPSDIDRCRTEPALRVLL